MAYPANTPRRVVIRANRDTLALIGGACAVTLVIAYGMRGQPDALLPPKDEIVVAHQDWTGHLAEVQPASIPAEAKPEPLSSESLTVPKAQLALPIAPTKTKIKPCDGAAPCVAKPPVLAALPAHRQVALSPSLAAPRQVDNSLLHTLNPLNHLPDMSTVKRPFAYAGDAVLGLFRRF